MTAAVEDNPNRDGHGPTEGETRPAEAHRPRPYWAAAAVVTLLAALVPAVVWPGDTPWMNDEPAQLAKAFHANEAHTLADRGLKGTLGVHYGPLPTQIYQLLLLITHDPVRLVFLRGVFCSGVTALALLWLARTLRLNPWFAACVMLAPYVWLWNRMLWDASFAIPVGSLALAAYASFLHTKSGRALLLALLCALLLPFIHFQDLPLAAPLLGHMLWRNHSALRRHWLGTGVIVTLAAALNWTYAVSVATKLVNHFDALVTEGHTTPTGTAVAMWHPLLGGKLLAGAEFATVNSGLSGPPAVVEAAKLVSLVPIPLVCSGVVLLALREVRSRLGARAVDPAHRQGPSVRETVGRIALVGLLLQMLLFAVMRVPPWPQYFFGTFPLYVLFAWIGVDALARLRLRGPVTAAYGCSVAVITLGSIWQVHRTGWNQGNIVIKLKDQVAVARDLNRFADASAVTNVALYQRFPKALYTLRLLMPPQPDPPRKHSGRLVIRYRKNPNDHTDFGPHGGRGGTIEVLEAESNADVPAGATRIPLMGSSE